MRNRNSLLTFICDPYPYPWPQCQMNNIAVNTNVAKNICFMEFTLNEKNHTWYASMQNNNEHFKCLRVEHEVFASDGILFY